MSSLVRLGNVIGTAGIATFGFLLNPRFGVQPLHYGLSILAALFGVIVAGRQAVLHIVPGTGAYGSALFGLHLYTWSAILFATIIAGIALLMIVGGQPDHGRDDHRFRGISRLAAWLLIAVTLANALNSFLLCGPVECDPNPASYWIAKVLR